jgi:hypothetical protein
VAKLKKVAPEVTEDHLKVHRPWGSYQSVDNGGQPCRSPAVRGKKRCRQAREEQKVASVASRAIRTVENRPGEYFPSIKKAGKPVCQRQEFKEGPAPKYFE